MFVSYVTICIPKRACKNYKPDSSFIIVHINRKHDGYHPYRNMGVTYIGYDPPRNS